MRKAFGYLRVSGKGQIARDGFPRQQAAMEGYAKAHGIKIVEMFREKGVPGKTELENRPALSALVEALHANGVKIVLVESLGRLARDLMVQESILYDLKRSGFELISVQEPDLNSEDPARKLMRQIMGAFHEYEKAMIVLKLRGARQRMRARLGRCEGRKPYGHREGEQVIIERIKVLRGDGLAYRSIAAILNQEGHKPRAGARWHDSAVKNILSRQEAA